MLAIAVLAGLGLALATRAPDNSTSGDSTTLPAPTAPASDGPDWTHLELLHHFRDSGLTVRMTPIGADYLYVLTDSQDDAIFAAGIWNNGRHDTLAVLCQKHATATNAKVDADRREKGTFAWGRFTFTGNEAGSVTLAKFQKASDWGAQYFD